MSYSTAIEQAKAVLADLRRQQVTLGKTLSLGSVELVEELLRGLPTVVKPDSIECAVRSRQVAFVRTSATADAQALVDRLTPDPRLKVVHRDPHIVQFWPSALPVQHFRVEQEQPFKEVIGEVYALNGADARDLMAANAGFGAREPEHFIEVQGRRVLVHGKPLFNADRSYFRSCKAVVAGHIETPQSWVSTYIS